MNEMIETAELLIKWVAIEYGSKGLLEMMSGDDGFRKYVDLHMEAMMQCNRKLQENSGAMNALAAKVYNEVRA